MQVSAEVKLKEIIRIREVLIERGVIEGVWNVRIRGVQVPVTISRIGTKNKAYKRMETP